ncbi:DDB1- and CUL4-associated factor 5-like, partial [Hoplias malabaricus]|uniref:DDB1- and CUL4-associated factor 5-like n=1 Tax=Hoplias malabaricus TaxID=27720 RepID=UPI003462D0D9
YILSGSDDFNLYMWKIPKDPEAGGPGRVVNGAFMVLKGHRSIVNQVRFNPHTYMICSSGVEKVIKVWSPYQQPDSVGDLEGRVEDKSRSLYTHEEYISLVLNSGSGLSHDYVSQSMQEDPRMMAFFDSLVRREIEGWSSDSDSDLSEGAILQLHARGRRSSRTSRDGGSATPAPQANAPSGHHTDSEHSSSSSLAGPDVSGNEQLDPDGSGTQRRRVAGPRASAFLLDLVNEDSDSSGFWLDPVPRPRSPSPRERVSSLSSHTSSVGHASTSSSSPSSSSSSSSSSSEGEEAELRRSSMRQRNAARRRRHSEFSGQDSVHSLQGATDYSSYPKISIHDPSSSSSSSGDDSQPVRSADKERGQGFMSSPTPSSDQKAEPRVRFQGFSPFLGHDLQHMERSETRMGWREELEEGKSSDDDGKVQKKMMLNDKAFAHVDNLVDSTLPGCSGAGAGAGAEQAGPRSQKRTRLTSGEEEEEPPLEKKFKT